ncbi:MAG: hypothetical protein ABI579_05425, partial [Candidatus Sumerlaeota bacterium]
MKLSRLKSGTSVPATFWAYIQPILLLLFWAPSIAIGQDAVPLTKVMPSADEIQATVKELQAKENPPEDIIKIYEQALQNLKLADEQRAAASDAESLRKTAPEELKANRDKLAAPPQESTVDMSGMPVDQLESELAISEQNLSTARTELSDLEREPQRRAARRVEIPKEIQKLRDAPAAATPSIALRSTADANEPDASKAGQMLAASSQALRDARIAALESELASYEARTQVLMARRDLAARNVSQLEAKTKSLRSMLDVARKREAGVEIILVTFGLT